MPREMKIPSRLLALHAYALLCVLAAASGLALTLWKYPAGTPAAQVALAPDEPADAFMGLELADARTL